MSKLLRGLSLALAAVLVATVLVAMPRLIDEHAADAANAAEFDPGHIISDENFYNGSAMTSAQISSWLKGANAGCVSGKNCILNYTENTPTMAADAYCGRLEGKKGESAASVIARVGKACDISQKALLVLLEKEQSLVSLRDVPNWKWESATGYGCPDTAPCDAGFGGFFTQVYYGARAYQYYKAHPTQYRHQPMAMNSVLYNPNSACGSSRVYIENYATAGLYNYTPYQPNRGALNNLYGIGDSCSAYGNRNFWRMYTDWFGNPTSGDSKFHASLVTVPGSGQTWLVDGSTRYLIKPEAVWHYRDAIGAAKSVSTDELNRLRDGGRTAFGIRSGDRIWQIDGVKRIEFMSCDAASDFGYDCGALPSLSMDVILEFQGAGSVKNLIGWSGGGWWYVKDGVRQQIPDFSSLRELGLSESRTWLSGNRLTEIPVVGPLMPPGDVAHDLYSGRKYLATKGGYLQLSTAQGAQSQFADSSWVWPGSVAGMNGRAHVSDRVQYPGKRYILGVKGLVTLGKDFYGSGTHFQTVQVPMLWGVPIDSVRTGNGILVQQSGSSKTWLVQNGTKQSVSAVQLRALESKYGSVVRTASDTTIGVPVSKKNHSQIQQAPKSALDQLKSGAIVESTSGEQFLYSDSDGLVAIEDAAFAAALGIEAEPVALEDFEVQLIGTSDTVLNTWGITCGGESYFAAGGELTLFAPDTLAHYPLGFVELPADICATLAVSDAEIGKAVTDADGQVWIIYEGRKHLASDEWLAENPPRTEPFALPAAYLKQVPTGTGLE